MYIDSYAYIYRVFFVSFGVSDSSLFLVASLRNLVEFLSAASLSHLSNQDQLTAVQGRTCREEYEDSQPHNLCITLSSTRLVTLDYLEIWRMNSSIFPMEAKYQSDGLHQR